MSNHLQDAVSELVAEMRSYQFPSAVTVTDAAPYVTPQVIAAWYKGSPRDVYTPADRLQEAIADSIARMPAAASDALADELANDPMMAGARLQKLLAEWIADHLAREANYAHENYEPSDDEMRRYG
jgi:hypothetical protein